MRKTDHMTNKIKGLMLILMGLPLFSHAQLVFEPASVDFGRQVQNQTLEQVVTITNTGTETVEITGTSTDCGCTVGSLGMYQLPPGTSTELTVAMQSRNYRGEVMRRVTVRSTHGDTVIPVKMFVNPFGDWIADEYMVYFPDGRSDVPQAREVTLNYDNAGMDTPPRLTAAKSDVPWLDVTFEQTGDRQYKISVTRMAGAPQGNLNGLFRLRTSDESNPELLFPVFAIVRSDVDISPARIMAGTMRVGQSKTTSFSLDGWKYKGIPEVFSPVAKVDFNGQEGGRMQFEVVITPDEVGMINSAVYILRPAEPGDTTQMERVVAEVPLFVRVLPQES